MYISSFKNKKTSRGRHNKREKTEVETNAYRKFSINNQGMEKDSEILTNDWEEWRHFKKLENTPK